MKKIDKAQQIHELFLKLNGQNRQSWEKVNQEGHAFFLDNQLSAKEKKACLCHFLWRLNKDR